MSKFHIGDTVRVKDSAFSESTDPKDAARRGAIGKLVTDFVELFGQQWDGCWEIQFEGGDITLVSEDEIEPANETG